MTTLPRVEQSKQDLLHPLRLSYDYELRLGQIFVPIGHVPDLPTTIQLFRRLDDGVRQVQVTAGDVKTLAFVLRDGHWFTASLT